VLATVALREVGGAEAEGRLAGIATGDLVVGAAFTELFSVREGAGCALSAGKVSGKAMMAIDACAADQILIALGPDRLAMVDRHAKGIEVTRLVTTDNTRCTGEVVLDGVAPMVVFDDCAHAISRALEAGRIALAADQLGACESMVEQAVRYSMQRKQFDRLIGSFQAVKHMCAEMIAEVEPARSLLWYAAHSFDASPEESALLACHVLAHLSEIGREIASVSTQVHGGIGWTDEQNLHFWYKRIGLNRHLLAGPDTLRERAAQLQSFDVAS
jgi:alkylation response protein AidB-like acyl-CoA dehydrogenase